MTTHSSILAWRIPMDRGAWRGRVHGVAKSWTRLKPLSTDTETERECKPAFMINYMGCLRSKAASIQTWKPGCEGRKVVEGKLNKPGGASRQPPFSQPLGRSLNRRGKTRCHQCLFPFSTFSASGLYPPAFLGGFPRDWLSNSYPKAAEGRRPLQWNVQRKCSCRWACDLVGDPSPLAVTVPSLLLHILKWGSCLSTNA